VAKRVTVKVEAPKEHPDVLDIQDAMRQVLDEFTLLTPEGKDSGEVVWRLILASANSPLVVTAEAVSLHSDVDISLLATAQIKSFAKNLRELRDGRMPRAWSAKKVAIATAVIRRNFNGIGATEVIFDEDEPAIRIDPPTAKESIAKLEQAPIHQFHRHTERGAVEGNLIDITTYYSEPAIRIKEHGTGAEIICTITQDTVEKINAAIHADDVWHNRRVSVHGSLNYDDQGRIMRVLSESVAIIPPPRDVTIDDLRDPEFTDGLDAAEYLERLREGELGR